jgi:uncharacterized membrane protein
MRFQKLKIPLTVILLTISILLTGSCRYDKAELLNPPVGAPVNCATSPAKFKADILPLITSKCATPYCHNTDASGGIVLQNYAEISAAKARIYERAVVEKSMPLNFPLQPAEINLLKCWIDNGAKDN